MLASLWKSAERPVASVPRPVLIVLSVALCLQIAWQGMRPAPSARAEALGEPIDSSVLRPLALGEPIALAQMLTLYLQAFDNQPGVSIPFRELDYGRVISWLYAILDLDPVGQYPLLMASQIYSQVPDPARQRRMCDFVHDQFDRDPDRRWRWLAQCAITAKHELHDPRLALSYADAITARAQHASGWARQMRIFILADLGELDAAKVLLGGLLASGEVSDPKEIHFLTERLKQMTAAGKSSPPSENRHPIP
jgi:hypothetical protein